MKTIEHSAAAKAQIEAFLVETGTNEGMRNENMASKNIVELVAVANRHGFSFTAADMIRHQAQTILSFTDSELELYTQSGPWWQLCLDAYAAYGR
jgi:predicted ribosomally synthesized peptide with nif11-like leader